MFSQFSTRLYEKIIDADYQLLSINGTDISDTTHWVAHKVEMSTPITLHVVSAEIISFPSLVLYDNETKQSMEVGTNIYILVGRNVPEFVGAEEYFGQSVYSIYWHVNLDTGEITVPQGQPKKLFNLHTILESTLHDNKSFSMAPRPHAKHRYPILAYGLIFVNLVILLLMYLDGYRLGDITVPIRFGAVIADFVVRGGEWWRLVAAMFIHFGFGHFFANSFGILVFGTRLERYLGRRLFFIAYIFSGLAGSAVSLVNLHFFQPFAVSAGASGAVYGIVGAMFAYTRITKRSIEFITWYLMLIYIGLGMAMGFATPGIDNFAHIGGLLMGFLIGSAYAVFKK